MSNAIEMPRVAPELHCRALLRVELTHQRRTT